MSDKENLQEELEFDLEKMKKFAERDLLIKRMVKGLGNDERAYRVIFNSEVIDDTVMEDIYRTL